MAENSLLGKLDGLVSRFEEVGTLITDPAVIADMKRFVKLNKEYRDLEKIVGARSEYVKVLNGIEEAKALLESEQDPEMREMAREELDTCNERIPALEEEIKLLLVPADPQDDKNAIVEIRGGTGGDEAALFAGDLYRMYVKYCELKGWKISVSSFSEGSSGGFKEIIFTVSGEKVYGTLKYESGVHRVQRVPETESGGRIHTSTITVAIMPEAEEIDFQLDLNDCKFDVFRASGNGGQCVNTTDSAVRLTHIPTGIVISCQDEKSQLKNREKCMRVLRARILENAQEEQRAATAQDRKSQVGTGDRSERIRTYNYPQGRVTDHRIGLTLHKLDIVLNGEMDELLDALLTAKQSEQLQQVK